MPDVKLRIRVGGMPRSHCAGVIVRAVSTPAGIRDAQVSLEDASVTAMFDDSRASPDGIGWAVEAPGDPAGD